MSLVLASRQQRCVLGRSLGQSESTGVNEYSLSELAPRAIMEAGPETKHKSGRRYPLALSKLLEPGAWTWAPRQDEEHQVRGLDFVPWIFLSPTTELLRRDDASRRAARRHPSPGR